MAQNKRGCYYIDTIKGCGVCLKNNPQGCYDNCYSKNIASRYGFDFSRIIKRDFSYNKKQLCVFGFKHTKHGSDIIRQINNIDMPFIRIGEAGDPSQDWEHTINICKIISVCKKPIVIVTKHWNIITTRLIKEIEKLNICINTSISALDTEPEIKHRLEQFNRLKNYCKSILRIVSCSFNKYNTIGVRKTKIQDNLFNNSKVIDTIFRPRTSNNLVIKKVINIERVKFLNAYLFASVFNENTFFGHCKECPDMCGLFV
ncbi:MAG: hypothetical protein ACW98X_25620 [Promethearchaeota archaeon]